MIATIHAVLCQAPKGWPLISGLVGAAAFWALVTMLFVINIWARRR